MEDTPKVKDLSVSPTRKEFRAKLRDPETFKIIEPLEKELYEGIFCNTKIIKPEVLNKRKEELERNRVRVESPSWNASKMGASEANPAAVREPRLIFPKLLLKQTESQSPLPVQDFTPPPKAIRTAYRSVEKAKVRRSSEAPQTETENSEDSMQVKATEMTREDSEVNLSAITITCTKHIQSPFSDNPIVFFESSVPVICLKLLPDVLRDYTLTYTLQTTDLSQTGFPIKSMPDLVCDAEDWIRVRDTNSRYLDLAEVLGSYQSVFLHTIRVVLVADGAKRRLIERLFFFGAKDGKGEFSVVSDLNRFKAYLKDSAASSSPQPKKKAEKAGPSTYQCLLQKVQELKASLKDLDKFPEVDSMKITTPRHIHFGQDIREEQSTPEATQFPRLYESPQRERKREYANPLTKGLLQYRDEDFQYRHETYAANLVYLEDQLRYRRAGRVRLSPVLLKPEPLDIRVRGQHLNRNGL